MTPDTLTFTGNSITALGFLGVISTAVILVTIWKSYWASPYRK